MSLQSQINQLRQTIQDLIDNSKKISDYNFLDNKNDNDVILVEKESNKETFKIKISELQKKYFQSVSESFYVDADFKLWLNLSTYTQTVDFVSGSQVFTLDFEPTMLLSLVVNGKVLMKNEYIYTTPNQLEVLGTMENGDVLEITYEHFIITP